jgi:hypothetical protein
MCSFGSPRAISQRRHKDLISLSEILLISASAVSMDEDFW